MCFCLVLNYVNAVMFLVSKRKCFLLSGNTECHGDRRIKACFSWCFGKYSCIYFYGVVMIIVKKKIPIGCNCRLCYVHPILEMVVWSPVFGWNTDNCMKFPFSVLRWHVALVSAFKGLFYIWSYGDFQTMD